MKKTIVSGLIITVIGAIMLALGIGMHGQRAVVFNGLTPHVVSTTKTTKTKTYAQADQIKTDVSNMNVVIKQGKTFTVKYAGRKANQPTIQKQGSTIIVKSKKQEHSFSFNGFNFSSTGEYHGTSNDKLTITVPENVNLKKLTLQVNNASHVSLANVKVDQADFRLNDTDTAFDGVTINSGQLKLVDNDLVVNNSTLTKTLIQASDSDITMNTTNLNAGNTNTHDGDVHFSAVAIANGYSITAKDGDVESLNTKADGYSTSANDGDNRLFSQSNNNGGTLTQNETAANRLQVAVSDGDVTVN